MRNFVLQVPQEEIVLKPVPQVNAHIKVDESLRHLKITRADLHERGREHGALPLLQKHEQKAQDHIKIHFEHELKAVPQDIQL